MAKYATMFFIPDNMPEILPELSGRFLTAWQFEDLKSLAADNRVIARNNSKMARSYHNAARAAKDDKEYWFKQAMESRMCATRHLHLAKGRTAAIRNAIVRESLPA